MPVFSEKQKAQAAVDELNVSFYALEGVSHGQLVEDVERLAALVVSLAAELDRMAAGGAR